MKRTRQVRAVIRLCLLIALAAVVDACPGTPLHPAASSSRGEAVSFYCDPDFGGPVHNGSAQNPWRTLSAPAWAAINRALMDSDVTVYFPARSEVSDADKKVVADYFLVIKRTDRSSHRLTLDGMSMYNTDPENPAWAPYGGDSRFTITGKSPIAVPNDPPVPQNYLTVRGFKAITTGNQAFYFFGGNHVIIENNDLSHAPGARPGPGLATAYIRSTGHSETPCVPSGPPAPHNCGGIRDLTIRNNVIHDTYGEGIYIGGCDGASLDCTRYAERFERIVITGNTLTNMSCANGGQGDGIDVKGPVKGLVISNNTIGFDHPDSCDYSPSTGGGGEDCIITLSPAVITDNFLYSCIRDGITLDETWDSSADRTGEVRDNVIVNAGNSSRYFMRSGIMVNVNPGVTHHWHNVRISGNSIYKSGGRGIEIKSPAGGNHQVTGNFLTDKTPKAEAFPSLRQ